MSGAAELQKYEYRPLREGPNNIRLIQILPGVGDAGIVCQVFQYTLRNDKAFGLYESLSYVWGDFDNPHDILVRNAEDSEYRTFKVTHNLYTALRRLRDPDLPRTFWIDAICINQHDLQERALQVTIMARIYAYATSVSVWLGEADSDSSAMFDLLQDILTQRSKHSPGWERLIESKVEPAADGVQALLDKAWFRRAWVVQEAAVARVASIIYGDAEMPGAMFAKGMDLALRVLRHMTKKTWRLPAVLILMDHTQSSLPLLQRISALQMSTAIPSFEIAPLGDLLDMFENHEATDERDKIYALLGLSSDNALTPDLRPDYTKSWSTLFRQVASHILGSTAVISVVEGKSRAVISDFGCALAWVTACSSEEIVVESPAFGGVLGASYIWEARWHVPHERGRCKKGDILIYLQGARRPCIIRPCQDHFDMVIVSLPEPEDYEIVDLPEDPEVLPSKFEDGWATLIRGARHASRRFTLIWDWSTGSQHGDMSHVAQIESESGSHPGRIQRCFNTARVLDDMIDQNGLVDLLRHWPSSASSTAEEKHRILLEHACAHWEDYLEVKRYIVDVRLCIWALNAPLNYAYVHEYWIHHGFIGPDLFDIVHLAKSSPEGPVASTVGYEPYVPMLEPFRNPLLPIMFPQYQPVKFKQQTRLSTKRTVSSHSGRYLIGLILAGETALAQPSDAQLDRLYKDGIMAPRFPLVHGILTEYKRTHLDPVKAIQRLFENEESMLDIAYLEHLLKEFSFDSALIYELLEHLAFYIDDWPPTEVQRLRFRTMEQLVDMFVRHLEALCVLEFESRAQTQRPFHSVLYFLYTAYTQDPLIPCLQVSKHAHSLPFSIAQKVEWAQKAVLRAISALRHELRLDELSSSDDEEPS